MKRLHSRFKLRIIQILIILSFIPLISSPSFANVNLVLEPYLGYSISGTQSPLGSSKNDTYDGVGIGMRAAAEVMDLFFAGPELSYFPSLNYTLSGSSSPESPNPSSSKFGFFVGIESPKIPVRFWFTYYLWDQAHQTVTGSNSGTISGNFGGYSYKFGGGYKILPFLSINAEYLWTNYSSYTPTGSSTATQFSSNQNIVGKLILLSVSAPFTLPI